MNELYLALLKLPNDITLQVGHAGTESDIVFIPLRNGEPIDGVSELFTMSPDGAISMAMFQPPQQSEYVSGFDLLEV